MANPESSTQLLFFHLPRDVDPKDKKSFGGTKLLHLMQEVQRQDGCLWSAWGRTVEDEASVIWATGEPCRNAMFRARHLTIIEQNGMIRNILSLSVRYSP